jgi:hypothetical protein
VNSSDERLDIVPHFSFAATARPLTDAEYGVLREHLLSLRASDKTATDDLTGEAERD